MVPKLHPKSEEGGIRSELKKKYLVIVVVVGVLTVILPTAIDPDHLLALYIVLALVGFSTLGLFFNVRFQVIHKILRPFIVARILQIIATVGAIALLIITFPIAQKQQAWLPYVVMWLLGFLPSFLYFRIFKLAGKAKKKHPERCEFC